MSQRQGDCLGERYYDIDAILSEEDRLPCTFTVSAFNLGTFFKIHGSHILAL